jgi:hypothetical protein
MAMKNGPTFELIAGLCKLAVEAERTACAELCDDMVLYTGYDCADAIRARGQQ